MKRSPFLKTYVALVIVAGLGAYMYFVELKRPDKPEKAKEKVFTLDKTKVRELALLPRDGEAIRVVKDGAAWKMTAPRDVPADSEAVEAMIGSLESLEIDAVAVESPKSLADFGLEKPRVTVAVLLAGATEPLKLVLGDKVPDGSGVYAKLPTQGRVLTVAAYLESTFDKKPFDLRDRDVLHVKRDAITTLGIAGPEGSYELAKSGKDEWAFAKPIETRAGRWAVDGLVGMLEALRMESVAAEDAEDLAPFGLDKPARRVVLGLAGGATKTLEIGAAADGKGKSAPAGAGPGGRGKGALDKPKEPAKYYARDAASRLVTVIPGAIVDDLAKGMSDLRAKRLLEVATYEVEGFDVEAAGARRTYARASSKNGEGVESHKWKRTAPDAKDLDTSKVQDVLFKIGGVEVQEFVDAPKGLEAYGLDKPALKATLRSGGGKPPVWIELGQKDGATYARRVGDASVLKLDAAKAEELLKAFKEI